MKLRIRMPGLPSAERGELERRVRMFLGRHASSIDSVECGLMREEAGFVQHAECELVVKLRDGGAIRVHDDGNHLHRALLRAVWRLDQRAQRRRPRDGAATGDARRAP